jgi:hypothetical protein
MFAEPLSSRPLRGSGDSLLQAEADAASAGSGGYLAGAGGPPAGTTPDGNAAAAAAAAVAAGMHHSFMAASPQEGACSTSMQLHTPMTGESTAGILQSSSYTVSGEPSPISRGHAPAHSAAGAGPASTHSSPLRPAVGALLDGADLAAVQSSLANMALQVGLFLGGWVVVAEVKMPVGWWGGGGEVAAAGPARPWGRGGGCDSPFSADVEGRGRGACLASQPGRLSGLAAAPTPRAPRSSQVGRALLHCCLSPAQAHECLALFAPAHDSTFCSPCPSRRTGTCTRPPLAPPPCQLPR